MFIAQPAHSFGLLIGEELLSVESGQRRWTAVEIAVAWLNYAGIGKVHDSIREFLAGGGRVRVTVGLDFGCTTYEGLSSLLDLEQGADLCTHVFFDENQTCTFHPKVFLFHNDAEARLLVGSNNMTGAGLETNIEAALSFSGALLDETIQSARVALGAWRDDRSDSRTRRLTRELLGELTSRRYVLTEDEIRARRRLDDELRSTTESPLFGRSSTRPQRPGRRAAGPVGGVGRTTGSAYGEVLLMRVRPRRNGNQVQVSMKILDASFMEGAEAVVSVDGHTRRIGYNMADGVRNTARFEAPEMSGMQNPVARFQWVNDRRPGEGANKVLQYEIFDADNDVEGSRIFAKLEEGIGTPPVTNLEDVSQAETVLSTRNRTSAQWYRLDSD